MTEDLCTSAVEASPQMPTEANNGYQNPSINGEKKTRKRGPFSIFKSALFMMRRSRSEQKKKVIEPSETEEVPSKGENWKKLVGSMRPLHVPDNQTPSLSPSTTFDNFEDLHLHASSSFSSFPSPSVYGRSSVGSMSQYASANNLQELDDNNSSVEDEDPDEVLDAICGDEMIDAKAEVFISQFYQQMKLQGI